MLFHLLPGELTQADFFQSYATHVFIQTAMAIEKDYAHSNGRDDE